MMFMNAGEIVSQHVQRHFGGDLWQAPHQDVGCPAKGMLGRLAALTHGLRVLVEALLDGLQHTLMLPARDTPLLAGRAARLERTVTTGIGPIAPQLLAVFLVGVVVLQLFSPAGQRYTSSIAEIDEVL